MKTVYQLKCKYMKTIESQGWGDRLTTTYRLYFNEEEYSNINLKFIAVLCIHKVDIFRMPPFRALKQRGLFFILICLCNFNMLTQLFLSLLCNYIFHKKNF